MNFIKTEYSFREVFYHLEAAVLDSKLCFHDSVCIIDSTTFGFVKFEKLCKKHELRPIFGLRLMMTDVEIKSKSKYDSYNVCEEIVLIAKNQKGISDLYELFSLSTEQKYYFNRIYRNDLEGKDVLLISNQFDSDFKFTEICIPDFNYSFSHDKKTYECISGVRGIPTHKQNTMTDSKLLEQFNQDQIDTKNRITQLVQPCSIPKAKMISYNGELEFKHECWEGLREKGLLDNQKYVDRLKHEISMIKSKNFEDYFMIVADMIKTAKETMLVGSGRGSSGGSLVCYVLGITNIDPIKFDLIFERFIDVNRDDLPDIDTDYPDVKRAEVIESMSKKYKTAFKLGTITRYQPKIVLNDFAKEYGIPNYELNDVKEAIIQRSPGDARAKFCLMDTFNDTEAGKEFIKKYPYMISAVAAESHARHYGTHAAGIIVLDEEITKYASMDRKNGVICLEGKDAESIGLLKIDCLGLRTLSVIENCLEMSGIHVPSIYDIDLEDQEVLSVFNSTDLSDVFQFDGDAIRGINKRINVKAFSDLVAITALGRPGALSSGGTERYLKICEGEKDPRYFGEVYEKITKQTHGIVVYQEQTMFLLRVYANFSWKDVNIVRKIMGKSKGDEALAQYKHQFVMGAIKNGHKETDIDAVWISIASMGKYAFNKSHAVAYSMVSYWCAYCKLKYPLRFLAANMNNVKDSDHGLRLLRQYVKKHGISYVPVDAELSDVGWTIQDGKLIGGLVNIDGIAEKKAKVIVEKRENGKKNSPSVIKKLENPITPYDDLYPIETRCKDVYETYNIVKIEDLTAGEAEIITLGKIVEKDLKDRNSSSALLKRGGEPVKTNTHYLNLVIQDDTGKIKCTIAPFDMVKLNGFNLAKILNLNDIISVKGKIREGWNTISVQEITKI